MSKVIAVTGKGGTGKTMLAALMVRILSREAGAKVLAIDADSAISLPYTLGMKVGKTLSEVRTEMIEDPAVRKGIMDRHVRTIITDILEPGNGFDSLVMGRSEGPGCYCGINDLLRYGIESLSSDFDITIVDGEAGPEQINRRVLQSIDILMIITDTSSRGFQTAGVIQKIAGAGASTRLGQKGLVVNRVKATESNERVEEAARKLGLKVFGHIPEDENITRYDLNGKPIIDLPDTSPSVQAVREILEEMEVGKT